MKTKKIHFEEISRSVGQAWMWMCERVYSRACISLALPPNQEGFVTLFHLQLQSDHHFGNYPYAIHVLLYGAQEC